jgi:putative oxidoreductase
MGNLLAPLQTRGASVGLFFVRIVVGLAFIFHGFPKITNPAGWAASLRLTAPWNGGMTAVIPEWLQIVVAAVEFFGGLALVFGILTRLAALLLCADMITAWLFVLLPRGTPFVGSGHSMETTLTYMVVTFMLLLTGPGSLSLDWTLFGSRPAVAPAQNARHVA